VRPVTATPVIRRAAAGIQAHTNTGTAMPMPFDMNERYLKVLIKLYASQPKTLDELVYTLQFDDLVTAFEEETDKVWTDREVWSALATLRKAKKLPTKKRKRHEDLPGGSVQQAPGDAGASGRVAEAGLHGPGPLD
jgi:hypothetical protein